LKLGYRVVCIGGDGISAEHQLHFSLEDVVLYVWEQFRHLAEIVSIYDELDWQVNSPKVLSNGFPLTSSLPFDSRAVLSSSCLNESVVDVSGG
jgi:hypothetical protein